MKIKLLSGISIIMASVVTFAAIPENENIETSSRFIIQGATQLTIKSNLAEVGAKVEHEHSVISAVSANLTESQQTLLLKVNPMLRMFKDNKVNVSSKTKKNKKPKKAKHVNEQDTNISNGQVSNVIANSKLKFSDKKRTAEWKLENKNHSQNAITAIDIAWPNSNISIDRLTVQNQEIDASLINNNTITLPSPIYLDKKTTDIKVSFNALNSVDPADYNLSLTYSDGTVETTEAKTQDYSVNNTFFPTIVRANMAHDRGITGYGVTVAIIDTGIKNFKAFKKDTNGKKRTIDAVSFLSSDGKSGDNAKKDENGHGTHLAGIISDATVTDTNDGTLSYNGIAPDVNLLIVKAFDEEGQSSYLDIIKSVEFVIENKDIYDVKVLNLSFSATPSSYYWDDPLNQVIMKAWEAGITVIAAAGNTGPDAMTIGVPGNTPYVITVGALSDNYTPFDSSDDFITSFSSAGPTYEGFVKPELVAPGGHVKGFIDKKTYIRELYSLYDNVKTKKDDYFELSGTSQATAVTTGVVALMLQANPNLTPDDIKCRLMDTANTAYNENGELAFSVFQQGAGLVDAISAIDSTASNCGNAGLNIAKDIAQEEHFIGPANFDENTGNFGIEGVEGLEWSGVYSDSQLWGNHRFSSDSQLWGNHRFSSDSQLWGNHRFSSDSQLWGNHRFSSDAVIIQNYWVDHE